MASYNRLILIGNLGRDAELRYTPSGKPVATTSVAVDDPSKKDDAGKPTTEWYRIKIWGKQAETLKQYLVKGKQIYVEGRLSIQIWTDREGHSRYTPEVSVDRVVLLGSGSGMSSGGGGPRDLQVADDTDQLPDETTADDIPF
jgi:single-strand DNA-binding protein